MSPESDSELHRPRRERSNKYPGAGLHSCLELIRTMDQKGLDGLSAEAIATAMGYKNIKTNTFSAKLSSSRQFGLIELKDKGYNLTALAKAILYPVDPEELPNLYRQAMRQPSLYARLIERFAGKRLPDAEILGNTLYHGYGIKNTAKKQAAEVFLETARFTEVLTSDGTFHPKGTAGAESSVSPSTTTTLSTATLMAEVDRDEVSEPTRTGSKTSIASAPASDRPVARSHPPLTAPRLPVRFDLRLWGEDLGKIVQVRGPETLTPENFERLVQALKLHFRIQDPIPPSRSGDLEEESA